MPAVIHFSFNYGTQTQSGFGIPMATDIAFVIGVLSILGNVVPSSLKIFVIAFAVIDDLCAIFIIAIFYSGEISWLYLSAALSVFLILFVLNRIKVYNLIPYIVSGIIMWFFMLHSGIHASVSGIMLAFVIPFGNNEEKSPSYLLEHLLQKPVAFIILPLFALANTAIVINPNWYWGLLQANSIGIILGLILGKPLGIILFSWITVAFGLSALPAETNWKQFTGAGLLGGIGFTMAIFITLLAFDKSEFIDQSKIAIIVASIISGVTGYFWLRVSNNKNQKVEEHFH